MRTLRALCGPFFVAAGTLHFARPRHSERYRVPGGRAALIARLPLQAALVAWVRVASVR